MKKKLALLLALCMAISLFAACGTSKTPSSSTDISYTPPASNSDVPSAEPSADSDLAYIKDKGTLVVGITDFAPMDYKDDAGNWIGFDADMAKAFAESLGVDAEFIEINWDNKIMEVQTKAIDCVWNGMTLTDEVKNSMATSDPYCLNAQVVVVPADKADQYQTTDSLKDLKFAVESGSAGQSEVEALNLTFNPVQSQASALMEVASGASDACVIDLLMAGAMIGEGTSYPNLTYTVKLNSEEYGVGFRKDSDVADAFNTFWKAAYDDGTVMETAKTYGVQESIIEK
ncbi:MAG: transporter substrate-binding domain-containing protein [Oscillospiraceae bacterium]